MDIIQIKRINAKTGAVTVESIDLASAFKRASQKSKNKNRPLPSPEAREAAKIAEIADRIHHQWTPVDYSEVRK